VEKKDLLEDTTQDTPGPLRVGDRRRRRRGLHRSLVLPVVEWIWSNKWK